MMPTREPAASRRVPLFGGCSDSPPVLVHVPLVAPKFIQSALATLAGAITRN